MRRREFVAALTTAAVWSRESVAQQASRTRRIKLIMGIGEHDPQAQERVKTFSESLGETGWKDGENATIEVRWLAQNPDRATAYASEVANDPPNVVVVNGTPGLSALHRLTKSIPIVFVVVVDPVGAGFVQSLSKPGGNVTGFSTFEPEIGGKWIETLVNAVPGIKRIGILHDPNYVGFARLKGAIEAVAPTFGVEAISLNGRNAAEIEHSIAQLAEQADTGLLVLPTVPNSVERETIFSRTRLHRLPAIYPFSFFAKEGGLISYGFDNVDLFRRSAAYVARILNGESPGDLPVQAPTKFELVINLKTAKALGLTIPTTLLARADEVIE
jgi:putative tryptophan/tyrosine transport system substrate-binding protein